MHLPASMGSHRTLLARSFPQWILELFPEVALDFREDWRRSPLQRIVENVGRHRFSPTLLRELGKRYSSCTAANDGSAAHLVCLFYVCWVHALVSVLESLHDRGVRVCGHCF